MPTKSQKLVLPDDLSKEFDQISNLLRNQLQSILVLIQIDSRVTTKIRLNFR